MDRRAIQELFDYTGWAWQRIERTIDGIPEADYARAIDGSGWPSLAACLTHFVSTYDGWLNGAWALALGPQSYPGDYPRPIDHWDDMKSYRGRVRGAFVSALGVPDDVLFAERTFDYGEGEQTMSRAEILTNLALHERGHHGDLNTLFHQLGVRSFYVDYTLFITRPAEFVLDEG